MRKKSIFGVIVAGLISASLFCGCGSSGPAYSSKGDSYVSYDSGYSSNGAASEEWYSEDAFYDDYSSEMTNTSDSVGEVAEQNRKLIRNVNMDVETLEFDALMAKIDTQVKFYGGYIESGNTYNGSRYFGYSKNRNANMTIRIPQNKFDEFIESFSGLCAATNRSESVTDVTLTYVDIESRVAALEVEEERLLELLAQAETLNEILIIEDRLTEIRYETQSYESQLRSYDNKVDYSTLYLYVQEVEEIVEIVEEPETPWERVTKGFKESLESLGEGFTEFGIWLAVSSPYIVLWSLIIFANVMIIRGIIRYNVKKARKRNAENAANSTAYVQPDVANGPVYVQPANPYVAVVNDMPVNPSPVDNNNE